jgi:hypothetical protein
MLRTPTSLQTKAVQAPRAAARPSSLTTAVEPVGHIVRLSTTDPRKDLHLQLGRCIAHYADGSFRIDFGPRGSATTTRKHFSLHTPATRGAR